MSNPSQEQKVQYLADILSLVAIVGKLDSAAMQRVLASLGNELADITPSEPIDPKLAARLVAEIAENASVGEAADVANDFAFVGRAWREVLDEYRPFGPYESLPFAEILFALVNRAGMALTEQQAIERFGGSDLLLPMAQLTAALQTYAVPEPNLTWEMIGFAEPDDQALIGTDYNTNTMYLFKSASSGRTLRFSELELQAQGDEPRREHDLPVEPPLFAAFIAGLAGDLLYYSARLRGHAASGFEIWERLQVLLSDEKPQD